MCLGGIKRARDMLADEDVAAPCLSVSTSFSATLRSASGAPPALEAVSVARVTVDCSLVDPQQVRWEAGKTGAPTTS